MPLKPQIKTLPKLGVGNEGNTGNIEIPEPDGKHKLYIYNAAEWDPLHIYLWRYDQGVLTEYLGSGITCLGESAFYCCSRLKGITIPNSVIEIGARALSGCAKLASVNIPSSVMFIGSQAFTGCLSLPIEDGIRYADTYLVEAVNKAQTAYTIKEGTRWIG